MTPLDKLAELAFFLAEAFKLRDEQATQMFTRKLAAHVLDSKAISPEDLANKLRKYG